MKSVNQFRFGSDKKISLGSIVIRISIGSKFLINYTVEFFRSNDTFLIRLDFLEKYKIFVNSIVLTCPSLKLAVPIARKRDHIYLQWKKPPEKSVTKHILFTKGELMKLHSALSHPSNYKLLKLLKKARPWETNSEKKSFLEEISKACQEYQRF